MLKLIEFHSFAPISVLPDAMLLEFLSPTATDVRGGGYLDIVPGGTKLAAVRFSPTVKSAVGVIQILSLAGQNLWLTLAQQAKWNYLTNRVLLFCGQSPPFSWREPYKLKKFIFFLFFTKP